MEQILLLMVILLAILAAAASAQLFLLHKLFRELARAYQEFEATNASARRILRDLSVVTGTASMVVTKGKDGIGAFCQAAEAVGALASEVSSFVSAVLAQGSGRKANITGDQGAEPDRGRHPAEGARRSEAAPEAEL